MKIAPIKNISRTSKFNIKPLNSGQKQNKAVLEKEGLMSVALASAISAASLIKPLKISNKDIEDAFEKNNYKKNEYGFTREVSDDEKKNIKDKFGSIAENYIALLEAPVYSEDIENMKDFLNIDKKNGRKILKENFNNFVFVYLNLQKQCYMSDYSEKCEDNKNYFQLMKNLAESDFHNDILLDSHSYKLNSAKHWNNYVRDNICHNKEMPEYLKPMVDNMTSYIEAQKIENPITLYKGSGYDILKHVKLKNGEMINLGKMMQETEENPENEQKIKDIIKNNNISVKNAGFLSTSYDKYAAYNFSKNRIFWTFITEPNTKGAFIDGINVNRLYVDEKEVLLQKNSKITLLDAEYNSKNGLWKISARVSN